MSLTPEQIVQQGQVSLLPDWGLRNAALFCLINCVPDRLGHHIKCPMVVFTDWAMSHGRLNGKPKRSLNYTLIENAKDLQVLDELMNDTTKDRTLTTAEIDHLLRKRGLVVMSISTRLSHLRRNYEAASQGTIKKREERRDGKRIVHYWRAEV